MADEVDGADAVARIFSGRAAAARPALIDGTVGAAYAVAGRPVSVFRLAIVGDRIIGVEVVADPSRVAELDVELL